MRAWRLHELGEPAEKLHLEAVDDRRPGPGQVLIDVAATGLTFPDVLMCQGRYQMPTQVPYTPGGEVSGTVAAVGEGVTSIAVGERVVSMSGKGLAERVIANAAITFRLPDEAAEKRFLSEAAAAGMIGLAGHRSVGGVRASIYNAVSPESCAALAELMRDFARRNG